jgi:hypothetical protein
MPRLTAARVKRISSRKIQKIRREKNTEKKELLEQIDTLILTINDAVEALNEALAVSKHYSKKYH